jgi:hypothetical protein
LFHGKAIVKTIQRPLLGFVFVAAVILCALELWANSAFPALVFGAIAVAASRWKKACG